MFFRLSYCKLIVLLNIVAGIWLLFTIVSLVDNGCLFDNFRYKKNDENIIDVCTKNFQYFDRGASSWPNSQAPWFAVGGTVYPKRSKGYPKLLSEQAEGDRILEQLMYVPENYSSTPKKIILSYASFPAWNDFFGNLIGYKFDKCPVKNCILTDDKKVAAEAAAIVFKETFSDPGIHRRNNQVWILLNLEPPHFTRKVYYPDIFNWTATYRLDSDISLPYGKWMYYNPQIRQKSQKTNFAANRTKKVAWFVSNCFAKNNRLGYAKELAKYIQVDIYGKCGQLKCPRTSKDCFLSLSKDYKFYLSFENSNCQYYISEKLFENAYGYNSLPVVMGARPEDYRAITPEGSFIHVDDFSSPADLAAYLHKLDQDDDLYNSYFQWKGTGQFINHHFWCRLCAMLHADLPHKSLKHFDDWYFASNICNNEKYADI